MYEPTKIITLKRWRVQDKILIALQALDIFMFAISVIKF
jgi:predicted phosphatase